MQIKSIRCLVGALSCIVLGVSTAAQAQLMIVGNDEKVGIKDVGALAFTAPGRDTINFVDGDVSILKVDGTKVTNTGKRLALPGHPAAMRGSHP